MGRKSQSKGKRGEEELRDILRGYGFDVERGPSQNYGTIPDVYGLPGIHVEVKRTERLNLTAAIEQAESDAERFGDGAPCVFHRSNRKPWKVTMLLKDWMKLYEKGNSETP